ncbi:hypothetical protein AD940_13930 [Gluconobacter thailandicus]|uniref:DUF4132 domain-containing protein n=1 Tax=Gluconobacter thailandicus TaxID=257438 RepID=UPI0007780273|nr:DUF4132 domain-containing protein [Gluconobacter thailandicus]KXV33045.1 hypothetical protein AD940_13930 [Gluconobacter thailandicus]
MPQTDLLDTDVALARMVLTEVGILENQLIRWMAEMEKIDGQIFWKLSDAWVARHKSRIAAYYGISKQPLLDNITIDHVPLTACMMGGLLGFGSLPSPPNWFRRYAKQETSHTLGIETSRLFPAKYKLSDIAPSHKAKQGMISYMRLFRSSGHSLPDEHWFDQAVRDIDEMSRDFPRLLWLVREAIIREDRASSVNDMDSRLELLQVPNVPRPSKKTLSRFSARLSEPDGHQDLDFARGFLQEYGRFSEIHQIYYDLTCVPPLYRAAIFPRFIRLINWVFPKAGSVFRLAEAVIQNPGLYTFRRGRPQDIGIMTFGKHYALRTKFPAAKGALPKRSQCGSLFSNPEVSASIFPGCLCMIAAAKDSSDVPWLLSLCAQALKKEDVSQFNRLVATVGEIATPDAIRGLARLRSKVRHSTMLGQLDAALAHAASASGLTTVEAEELVAPQYGLNEHLCRVGDLSDGIRLVLSIMGSGQGVIRYEDAEGKQLSKLSEKVRKAPGVEAILRAARADAKMLTADMSIHRLRLERSWLTGQTWLYSVFQERWLSHPVLGWLARRQIWLAAEPDGTVFTCLFGNNGEVYDPDGNRHLPLKAGVLLSLWHPLHGEGKDADGKSIVARWRATLERLKISQPIRQAWRETYTLTQAERESSPASYRYAGRILNQAQVVEVGRKRGWRIRNLSPHIPSSESAPWTFGLPAHGIYAEIRTGGVGINGLGYSVGTFVHVITDRIRFCVLKDRGNWLYDGGRKLTEMKTPLRLGDISQVVFSEIMRDVDLMVSTAASNLSFDPETISSIPDLGVWRRQSGLANISISNESHFGGLAQSRREAIVSLLPSFKAGNAISVDGNYVFINGVRHNYKINIGTGDVMVIPYNRHLVLRSDIGKFPYDENSDYRPLHDDDQLDLILNRITMLLKDNRIRDQDILAQLASLSD